MFTIISPAKTIQLVSNRFPELNSKPKYLKEAEVLVGELRKYDVSGLEKLMKASKKIAELNFERYASWKKRYSAEKSAPALLAFNGEVFNGLQAQSLSKSDLEFAQDHMCILSGLYGVLSPNDLILPYRLEMGTKSAFAGYKNLYDYWKDIIPNVVSSLTGKQESKTLINLASNEYFSSIKPKIFKHRIITPVFKEFNGESYRMVTVYAKKARGMMLRYILQNKITAPEHLKGFEDGGYMFNQQLSDRDEWVFVR